MEGERGRQTHPEPGAKGVLPQAISALVPHLPPPCWNLCSLLEGRSHVSCISEVLELSLPISRAAHSSLLRPVPCLSCIIGLFPEQERDSAYQGAVDTVADCSGALLHPPRAGEG